MAARLRGFLERVGLLLGLACLLCGSVLGGWTQRIDNPLLDALTERMASAPAQDIIIVSIDDRSLSEVGQWPWPRSRVAALVDQIAAKHPHLIELDILFTEPSRENEDHALATSLAKAGNTVIASSLVPAEGRTEGVRTLQPVAEIVSAARTQGHVSMVTDEDDVIRRLPLVVRTADGSEVPHMQLAALKALGPDAMPPETIRLAKAGNAPIFAIRPAATYRMVSASAILRGDVPAVFLRNAIVLIGATAVGLGDTHLVSPNGGEFIAGVEMQANLLQALREGRFIREAGPEATLLVSFLPLLLLVGGLWTLSPRHSLLLLVALTLATVCASTVVLLVWGLWLPPGSAALALALAYPLGSWRRLSMASSFLMFRADQLSAVNDTALPSDGSGLDQLARQIARLDFLIDETSARREFLQAVIDAAPDAICVFDHSGNLRLHNARATDLFVTVRNGITLNALLSTLPVSMKTDEGELILVDGRHLNVTHAEGSGIVQRGGINLIIFRDVTTIRTAEAERRQMLEILSHDMRSPQVAILSITSRLDVEEGDTGQIARIRNHARRTLSLADNFVQLARLAEVPLVFEDVDAGALIDEAVDRLWSQAREKDIQIDSETSVLPSIIRGDAGVLSRVLDNLLTNAVKYCPPGARISVQGSAKGAGNGMFEIEIADNGPGLPPARRANPFQRFGERGTVKENGVGLGMAFVARAIELHAGRIDCECPDSGGTRFTVSLPALPPADDQSQSI